MKWTTKAKVMQFCSVLPMSGIIYKELQKKFGRLTSTPSSRLHTAAEMVKRIHDNDKNVEDKSFLEVGTGHLPIVPIGLFLCGASKVITVDLNRRLDLTLFQGSLQWIASNQRRLRELYSPLVRNATSLQERLELISKLSTTPKQFLEEANIHYLAPGDASSIDLPTKSIDYHISNTVMEHIPSAEIKKIFIEGRRLLKEDGLFIHFIDLSDHFCHQDEEISPIHFLQYSDDEWLRIAGNQFAYCNRLRASDFIELFSDLGLSLLGCESTIDAESMLKLENGFEVAPIFSGYTNEDLSKTAIQVVLKPYE